MTELNKDGLIAGSQVDFETMKRINRERNENARQEERKRSGAGKIHTNEQQVQNTPKPTRKKKA